MSSNKDASKAEDKATGSSSDPPEDAGRPFVFAAAQNVGMAGDASNKDASGDADAGDNKEDGEGSKVTAEGDRSTDAPEATPDSKPDTPSTAGTLTPSGSTTPQIPMEFMNLQRSQSIREGARRASTSGSGAASASAGGQVVAAVAAGDLGKRRSSRAIKRKRFDDEIVDTASCIAPPGGFPPGMGPAPGVVGGGATPAGPATPGASPSPSSSAMSSPQLQIQTGPSTSSSALSPSAGPTPTASVQQQQKTPLSATPTSSSRTPGTPLADAPKSAPPLIGGPSTFPGGPTPSTSSAANAAANAAAAAAMAAKLNKGKGVGKIAKSSKSGGAAGGMDWEAASLANSRAALKKKSSNKKKKKREGAWKDLSRWKPTDDLALITAVQQTHDLASVYRGVKFTCHFTLSEVQERWFALMYEPIISKMAIQAIKNLHPELILATQRRTLFSKQEQEVVSTIKASTNPPPTMSDFAELLKRHPQVFHHARTPRCLAHYWQSLKQYTLLPDQSVQPLPRDNHILNFLDAESAINDGELTGPDGERDEMTEHELAASDRRVKKEIRHLEAEVSKWQVLVDQVRGDAPPDFDNQTLAVLRGRLVRYLMRSKEITIGRSTADHAVDVDLKLEGPAWKISRKQGVIKLRNSGEFLIANEGKRAMFVDGKPIIRGHKTRLCNNSVLEIAGLKFVFLINLDLIEAIRQEAIKLYQNS